MTELDLSKDYCAYAKDVVDGNILANRYIILACQRFLDWFERDDIYFDYDDIDRKLRFISKMKHTRGAFANKNFVPENWQAWVLANIFGWKWVDTDLRVTKNVLLFISRKNGKSSLCASMALCMALCDNEEGAEVACLANTGKQAGDLFEKVKDYAESLDPHQQIFKRYRQSLNIPLTHSKVLVFSSDAASLDGYNISCALIDEFHAAKNYDLYNVMKSSMAMRTQPLTIVISTAGFNVGEEYPLYDMWSTCKEILEGLKHDDTQFSAIYQLDEEDDWKDKSVWTKCSPGYPRVVRDDFMEEQLTAARNSPALEAGILTKTFNKFCLSEQTWIPNDDLMVHTEKIDLKYYAKLLEDQGLELFSFMGVDLGSNSDFTAIAVLFAYNDKLYFKVFMFVPTGSIEKSKNKDLYRKWIKDGYLFTTNSNRANYEEVMITVREINGLMPVLQCAYDRYNASDFVKMCEAEGIVMTPFSQRCAAFNEPTKEFERRLMNGEIVIDDNPVLRWCFANILIERDRYENMKPTKAKGASGKIDGVIALLQAFGVYMQAEGWVAPAVTNV